MAKIVFYDTAPQDEATLGNALQATDHQWVFLGEKISDSNIRRDSEVISVFVSSQVTRSMIEAMPSLRLIACRSTGFNNIDLQAAAEHNVVVVNVPSYGEATVAEYAFALLLALIRKLPQTLRETTTLTNELTGHELAGKTFGVIGTGRIGARAIAIARGFDMSVVAYDAYPNEALAEQLNFKYAPLEDVASMADVISLHAPYNDSTHHMVDAAILSLMKSEAVLVNTARGELVNTKDLVNALNEKRLAGAALDVIEGEALLQQDEDIALLSQDHVSEELLRHSVEIAALQKMSNVIITPHNAFNTIEAVNRINQVTAQNITDFWYGHVPNKVETPPSDSPGRLLLVRHAESEWNATGQWTGITDVHLSEKGRHEAVLLGLALKDMNIRIDQAFYSEQVRTLETLEGILTGAQQPGVLRERAGAINERDYGEYTGKNKWEMRDLLGEEKFNRVRRGWDEPIPGGESLKTVYERVVPFYLESIVPLIQSGKDVLIVGHGNSIRSLMKYIEKISDAGVEELEMLFGEILDYEIDAEGRMVNKKVVTIDTTPPNA